MDLFATRYYIRRNKNIWEVWKSTLLTSRLMAWALTKKDAQAILNTLAQRDQEFEQ